MTHTVAPSPSPSAPQQEGRQIGAGSRMLVAGVTVFYFGVLSLF